jgi:aerobic C4-dicarboxylate transport protein
VDGGPPVYSRLYVHVLIGIVLGILLGYLSPSAGVAMKPLGDGFIRLIRMMIAPVVFTTVVVGIARMGDVKAVGRIGVRALVYFELVSTVALLIGLLAVSIARPGVGINADPATLDAGAVAAYTAGAQHLSTVDFLTNVIPVTAVDAFTRGDILQVLLFSILFGLALLHLGERGRPLVGVIEQCSHVLFGMVGLIMWTGSIGAFGAMAFTVGQFGIGTLASLGNLIALMYATCACFVFAVLGTIAWATGFSIWKFTKYIKEELLIVFGTSSSETVLPRMMAKLEHLGCAKSVVGLVVPTGYSFNLDGTSIYMTMATVFIAQAMNVHLRLAQELGILAILLLTSKGAAAVTGGGFVTLAATLSVVPTLPVAGLALLIGIDRFMSTARALTNLMGNGVATIVVAKWDGAVEMRRLIRILNGESILEAERPEDALLLDSRPVAIGRE